MNTSKNGSEDVEQFIRYLYEYEEDRPIRNVGFVKVERNEIHTTVHIHGKGLHLEQAMALKLYLVYPREIPIWICQGEVQNGNPTINYRLTYTEEDTGEAKYYLGIGGILMESEDERRYVAWWSDEPLSLGTRMIWGSEPENADDQEEEEPPSTVTAVEMQTQEEIDTYIPPSRPAIRKIQRQEIALLPRCEWRVANNSFLLHGYYNYHYLILLEEGETLWLGVPGIYHKREAKAAEAFGFGRFVRGEMEDTDETEIFGYWCRRVRQGRLPKGGESPC